MEMLSEHLLKFSQSELVNIGTKLTTLRKKLLALFEANPKPLTVVDIEKKLPEVAKSSLYRNLGILENAGLIVKIVNENDFAYYELTEQVIGHHHHLRCIKCGEVIDIEINHDLENSLEKLAKTLSRKNKYHQTTHQLEFSGICNKCC